MTLCRPAPWALLICWLVIANDLQAQVPWPDYPAAGADPHAIDRGDGGYFSWIKLILLVAIFLPWVRVADWINRDAVRFSEFTELPPKIWNPIVVFSFLGGFVAAITIPMFVAGFAVYVLAAALPLVIYLVQRRGKIPESEMTGQLFPEEIQQLDLPIKFQAAGTSHEQSQSNLIRARQSPAFEHTAQLLHDSVIRRGERILLDYTRDAAALRMQVDGMWHQLPTLDRPTGDALLVALKHLADLNPAERRRQQRGQFEVKVGRNEVTFDMVSQGVPTGERVLLKLISQETLSLELEKLGMSEESLQKLSGVLGGHGYAVISAPSGQGLSSTWQATLNQTDRFIRDWVAIVEHDDKETERENIETHYIQILQGDTPAKRLPGILLKQPTALVVPNPVDARSLDMLTQQVVEKQFTVISRLHANTAVEAILKLMALSEDRGQFVRAIAVATCQRLVRRLCNACKKPVSANPKTVAQMGGDPQATPVVYIPYQLPPPEQRVDKQGKPIEMEPCSECGGLGYVGRIAVFELILIDDAIRQVLLRDPKLEAVAKIARQRGNLTLLEEGYRLVLSGVTSLNEIQRVMQPKS